MKCDISSIETHFVIEIQFNVDSLQSVETDPSQEKLKKNHKFNQLICYHALFVTAIKTCFALLKGAPDHIRNLMSHDLWLDF